MPLEYALIASGANVSGNVDLTKRLIDAVFVPTVTSGDLLVQGNFDTTSAQFRRLLDVRGQQGSGDLRFAVGVGSRMAPWPAQLPQPAFARFEAAVTQTDNRTLVLVTRPR